MEKEIERSERFVRDVLNTLPAHIVIVNNIGRIVDVNEAWKRFAAANGIAGDFNWTEANYLSECEASRDDDVGLAMNVSKGVRSVLQGDQDEFSLEYPCHSPNEQRWFTMRARRIRGDSKVVIIHDNITELKLVEASLRQSEELFRQLVENIREVFWIRDLKTSNVIYINRMFEEIWGKTAEPLYEDADSFLEWVYEEDKERISAAMHDSTPEAGSFNGEYRILRTDGSMRWIWARTFPIRDEKGEIYRIAGIARDITDRKEMEETLRQNEEFLTTIIENIPNMIFVKDAGELRYVQLNKAGEDLLGYSREELIGKNDYDFFPKEQADFFTKNDRDVLKSGIVKDIPEEPIETRYKGKRMLHTKKLGVYTKEGATQYLMGISEDITDRKRSEEEIKSYMAKLEQSNQALQHFAYIASHDLQEPLRTVSSFVQLIERRYKEKLDAVGIEYIAFVVDGARRMQALINDLLQYSRVETQGNPFEPTDMETIFSETIAGLQANIEENGVIISHDPLPKVPADPSQMIQLLQNLIGNALKFHSEKTPEIHVSAKLCEGEWLFSVKDNGIGIDEKFSERIFKIFQRLHTREEYPGTGIGLAVCKKIAERHGGRLWVESQDGMGSTFFFTIPKACE
jgi:PAS domain S-box-containing protein